MKFQSSALLALPSLAAAFCHHDTELWARDLPPSLNARAEGAIQVAEFTYEGETGALGWHAMKPEWKTCATGKRQSPANLELGATIKQIPGSDVTMYIPNVDHAELENLGSTLEVVMTGGWISYGGVNGTLRQFHFHTPSEHHINGEHFPMEVHFVFDAGSSLIVLGVPIEIDTCDDSLLTSVFKNADAAAAPGTSTETGPLNFKAIYDRIQNAQLWNYAGSLTTPPCSEVVTWLVASQPLRVSPKTYKKTKSIMGYNARYTQNTPEQINLIEYAAANL